MRFTVHCNQKLIQQPYVCFFGSPRYNTSHKNNGLIVMINTGEHNKWTIVLVLPICCIKGQNISKYLIVHTTFTVTQNKRSSLLSSSLQLFTNIRGSSVQRSRRYLTVPQASENNDLRCLATWLYKSFLTNPTL